jgi:5-methylcytosine-specific restriction endonuclease McrA
VTSKRAQRRWESGISKLARSFMRRAYYHAQGGLCPICGKRLTKGRNARANSTLVNWDHVWPRSRSAVGWDAQHQGGLLLAHVACNEAKGDRNPTGCEQLMLFATNRALGYAPHETAIWDGPPLPPTRRQQRG